MKGSLLHSQVAGLLSLVACLCLVGCGGAATRARFSSEPAGAMVTSARDGELGLTPLDVRLTRAEDETSRSFIFHKEGYQEERVEAGFAKGALFAHAILRPLRTSVEVRTIPTGVAVAATVDGGPVRLPGLPAEEGARELDDAALWRGRERIELRIEASAPGHERAATSLKLERGARESVVLRLEEKQAKLRFNSTPTGAAVYDSRLGFLGRTPFTRPFGLGELVRKSDRRDQNEREEAWLALTARLPDGRELTRMTPVRLGNETEVVEFHFSKNE